MTDFIGGTGATVVIPLMKADHPIIPQVGSVTYTVFGHDGAPMPGLVDVALATEVTTHTLTITVPAAENSISVGKRFERRTVIASFTSNGKPYQFTASYRLLPLLNHATTAGGVRGFLGVTERELPDADIDLFAAYLQVEADFAPTELAPLLATGTVVELAANEAIRMRAALDVLPGLRQRITQMEANGIHQFRRVEIRDFDKVEQTAWERYGTARAAAINPTDDGRTFVLVTTDTDPITGE